MKGEEDKHLDIIDSYPADIDDSAEGEKPIDFDLRIKRIVRFLRDIRESGQITEELFDVLIRELKELKRINQVDQDKKQKIVVENLYRVGGVQVEKVDPPEEITVYNVIVQVNVLRIFIQNIPKGPFTDELKEDIMVFVDKILDYLGIISEKQNK